VKRELDTTIRPKPITGETLDSYLDRYLKWLENEVLAIVNDTMRRTIRRQTRRTHSAATNPDMTRPLRSNKSSKTRVRLTPQQTSIQQR
jgi:hypothetical protein